jgi:nucleotide-binding universal stress UspA family protein
MAGIIVGIDGSDHSRRALEWAVHEAAVRSVPLTVLTVQQEAVDTWGGPVMVLPAGEAGIDKELAEQARVAAQRETDRMLAAAAPDGRPARVTVNAVTGRPAEELLKAADGDADMIVVGSRGSGGFKRLLMGSVSTEVTHHARCPVVVVPSDGD